MEQITYSQFAALDIRIGTIVAVEPVPETDKLLQLTVSVGEAEPRTIVSGIRDFFPEYAVLVGRQCPFICNLEPRVIRGVTSHGMILAAGDEAAFALLSPHTPVPAGTKVR